MPGDIDAVVELCLARREQGPLDIAARRVAFDARPELGPVVQDVEQVPVRANGVPAEMLVAAAIAGDPSTVTARWS